MADLVPTKARVLPHDRGRPQEIFNVGSGALAIGDVVAIRSRRTGGSSRREAQALDADNDVLDFGRYSKLGLATTAIASGAAGFAIVNFFTTVDLGLSLTAGMLYIASENTGKITAFTNLVAGDELASGDYLIPIGFGTTEGHLLLYPFNTFGASGPKA